MIDQLLKTVKEAEASKKQLETLVNTLTKSFDKSDQKTENIEYFKNTLNKAMRGEKIDIEELTNQLKDITNAS